MIARSGADSKILGMMTVALACVVLRCVSTYDQFPFWSGDPFVVPSPLIGLTPAWALILDAMTLACGAAIVSLLCLRSRTSGILHAIICVPFWLPFLLIAWTVWGTGRGGIGNSIENLVLAGHWSAALGISLAIYACVKDHALRASTTLLVGGTLLAVLMMVVPKGIAQVYVEHPQMMQLFRENQASFLASQGWSPDSAMARGYIRRLQQPEASGWFGLANVFATLAASGVGCFVTLLGLEFSRERSLREVRTSHDRNTLLAVLALGGLICACGVVLAGSKGGYAAMVLGLGLGGMACWLRRKDRTLIISSKLTRWLGPGLVACTLLAVVARGLVGERVGELSILFRWFYMLGAARIVAHHPLGVGPTGFKDAYMIYKPAIAPEDTAFAHSVLIDWITTLGVVGVGVAALWLLAASFAGWAVLIPSQSDIPSQPHDSADEDRTHVLGLLRTSRGFACLAMIASTGVAAVLERQAATPETGIVRASGILLGLGVIWALHRILEREAQSGTGIGHTLGPALGVAALVSAVHSQIELSGVTPGSAAWCGLVLALAAGLATRPIDWRIAQPGEEHLSMLMVGWLGWVGRVLALVTVTILLIAASRAITWQRSLSSAYVGASVVQEFIARREEGFAMNGPNQHAMLRLLGDDIAAANGSPLSISPSNIDEAIQSLQLRTSERVQPMLDAAVAANHDHFPTLRASSRLALLVAQARVTRGEPVDVERLDAPIRVLLSAQPHFSQSASYWSWLGTMWEQRAGLPTGNSRLVGSAREALNNAALAWEQAVKWSPHDPLHTVKISDLYVRLGDEASASAWAKRSLEINVNLRLDPLRQLTETEVSRLRARQ